MPLALVGKGGGTVRFPPAVVLDTPLFPRFPGKGRFGDAGWWAAETRRQHGDNTLSTGVDQRVDGVWVGRRDCW